MARVNLVFCFLRAAFLQVILLGIMSKTRFVEGGVENGETIYTMMDEFLVVCPHCNSCASIRKFDPTNRDWFAPRRLLCEHCSFTKDWAGRSLYHGWYNDPPFEPCFALPLWLSTRCCGHILWAYNLHHLKITEQYVSAELRENVRHPRYGWFNQSLFNRLPKWIKEAKNRDKVLKAITKLKQSV